MRERAREELDPDSTEARILNLMLETAVMCGRLRDGEVSFNANQEQIAGEIGMSQRGVGKAIQRLLRKGFLVRTRKGTKKIGNSRYLLKGTGSITDAHTVEPDDSNTDAHSGGGSTTEHAVIEPDCLPPVDIYYRTEGSRDGEARSVEVPFIESAGEVFAPTLDVHRHDCLCDGCLDRLDDRAMPSQYVKYRDGASGKTVRLKENAV